MNEHTEYAEKTKDYIMELQKQIAKLTEERDKLAAKHAAAVVRHGHWVETIENGKMKRVTSCCGDDQTKLTTWYRPDYCPHCGAKMNHTVIRKWECV